MRTVASILQAFERFPSTDIAGLLGGKRALILAPHPDDESLGCGGLIAGACDAGLAPIVVILTDGAGSHPGSALYPPHRLGTLREQEAVAATTALGLPPQNLYFLRAADGALPAFGVEFERMALRLNEIGRAHGCGIIVAPWSGDPHCDHQATAAMAGIMAAQSGWALFSYPVWGWLRAGEEVFDEPRRQGWRLDISSGLARKQKAIAAHRSQHGGIIEDSTIGFVLPEALLRVFARGYEVYIT